MDIKNTTGSLYTDWQWLSRQCQTDALVSKSSSQVVKQTENLTRTEGQCGQGCPSLHWLETYRGTNFQNGWKPTSHNHGTVRHTRTQSYPLIDVNQAPGLQKSQGSSTQLDISSLWTSPKAKSQTVQPNTSRVMLWC